MSVIPIDPKEVIIEKDDAGNEFHFRYITGENRAKFMKAQSIISDLALPYVDRAKKRLKKNATVEEISTKAIELARKDGVITQEIEDKSTADMVDILLCNWKAKKGDWPIITEDNPPSKYLTFSSLAEVMEMAGKHIDKLMGLTIEDRKNSTRRQ